MYDLSQDLLDVKQAAEKLSVSEKWLRPIRGGSVCNAHGGAAPQVREAAARRLENAIDRLLAALLHIAEDGKQPAAARVAAIKDALDRADFGKERSITVKVEPWLDNFEGLFVDTPDVVDGEVVEDAEALGHADRALLSRYPADRDRP